jgi:hypothetical protein
MATIRLFIDELEEGRLPRVCMRCGAPATVFKRKRFSWGPGWVMALVAGGALCSGVLFVVALLILVPLLLRTMHVSVPLCEAHRHHWRALTVVILGGLSLFGLLLFAAILFGVTGTGRGDWRSDLVGPLALGAALFLVCLLFPAAFLQMRTIRVVEMTPESIRLTGVSREFVRALSNKVREGNSPLRTAFDRGELLEKVRVPPAGRELPRAVSHGELAELIEQLKDPRPDVRWDAARQLGQKGTAAKAALPHLAELVDDRDAAVRRAVSEAMRAIDPEADEQAHG